MVLFLYTFVSYTHYNKIDLNWEYVQVGISNKMPTVSANRSPLEQKVLEDTVNANIESSRKQQRSEIVRTVNHLNRSLDVLANNGYEEYVQDFCGEIEVENTEDWEKLKKAILELDRILKAEKQTLNDKLQIIHNADKIFKHVKKNRDLVVRRSKRIRHLTSLKRSIKNNELI